MTESQLARGENQSVTERLTVDEPDSREHVWQDEMAGRIRDAIRQLSPEQREVVVLSKYQDMSYREIAEVLDISPDSVKQRAYRAHLKLREILQPLMEE